MKLHKKPKPICNKLLPLTPCIYDEINKIYVNELIGFVNDPKTNNVALMGDYGTGKSSILEQLKNVLRRRSFLWCHQGAIKTISFLSFRVDGSPGSVSSGKDMLPGANVIRNDSGNGVNNNKSISKSRDLRSLMQSEFVRQLFYSVSPNKLRGSHYSRVGRTSPIFFRFIAIVLCSIFGVYCGQNILVPDVGLTVAATGKALTALIMYMAAYFIIVGLADYLFVHPPKSLGAKDIEIVLSDDNNNDLEQLLDEIIYFFNETGCRVLIIEDIDRLGNLEIYEDLRDLNVILNSTRKPADRITFIYAMRPSLLPNIEQRSKLFDAVVPVVPFVSSESSYDYARRNISEAVRGLSVSIDGIDNVVDRTARLISCLTSDARSIKEIVNSIVVRAHVFCCNDNAGLYRSNFLQVAVMSVVQEIDPSMYVSLCDGSENDLDKCYSECLQIKQREVDSSKSNCQFKKDDDALRVEVSRELVLSLRNAVKSPAIYYFTPDKSQGDLFSNDDAKQVVERVLSGETLFFYESPFLNVNGRLQQSGVVVCNMLYIEQLSDVGKKLIEIERNSIDYYNRLYGEAIKRNVWSYLDDMSSHCQNGVVQAIARNELLSDDYRLYITPIKAVNGQIKTIRYRRMYLQPRMIADYSFSLSNDDVRELISDATDAELSSPAMLNYSIAKYVFMHLDDNKCAYCAKLLVENKYGKDLDYLLDFYLSFLNNCANEAVSNLSAIIDSGKLFNGAVAGDITPYYNLTEYIFENYSDSITKLLTSISVVNNVLREMCQLFWLKNIDEDSGELILSSAVLTNGISIRRASENGLGNKLARLLKISGVVINDLAEFGAKTNIDEVVGLWCFRLTTSNLSLIKPGVLTNVLATGTVSTDDMKFVLLNGSSDQKNVVLARVFSIWNANQSALDGELARCVVSVLRDDDAYQGMNPAFIASLLEQHASDGDVQIILPKYIDSLDDSDVLRAIKGEQYRMIIDGKAPYVRIQAHDGWRGILDRLKTMGYVNRYEDKGDGKVHVVPVRSKNEV